MLQLYIISRVSSLCCVLTNKKYQVGGLLVLKTASLSSETSFLLLILFLKFKHPQH